MRTRIYFMSRLVKQHVINRQEIFGHMWSRKIRERNKQMAHDETYLLYIQDHDKQQFAISEPVSYRFVDDWIAKVCEQKDLGRSITCQEVTLDRSSELIKHGEDQGYSQVNIENLLKPPRDRQYDFIGSLPKYAQSADRSRIVKILCKGRCGKPRLAVLNKAYPGHSELRAAEMGEYLATCLMCSSIARDNYNWHR